MKTQISQYIKETLQIDDEEVILDFINSYEQLLTQTLSEMHTARTAGNFSSLRSLAHALKGASANVGAETVRSVAEQLQKAAEAQESAKCDSLIAALESFRSPA